jgi:hypothetical protein
MNSSDIFPIFTMNVHRQIHVHATHRLAIAGAMERMKP